MSERAQSQTETVSPYDHITGKTTVEVECLTPRAEPSLCDGWSTEVDLDEPARLEGDRIILPGFDGECPECGDSCFSVEGTEVMFRV